MGEPSPPHHLFFPISQDGYGTPEQHLARAEELGYDSMAFTEHGNVSSHFRAEKAAAKTNVRPIFGLEAYCGDTNPETRIQAKNHLILLAKDAAGYRNLNELVSQSWRDFHYYPTVGGSNLAAHSSGLICLSGCNGSLLACTLVGGKQFGPTHYDTPDISAAIDLASRFKKLFGSNYYLEVQQFPELESTCAINPVYELISGELDIPLVATGDVHYPMPDDNEMQVILHAADRGGKTVDQQSQTWEYDVRLTLPESDATLYGRLKGTGLSKRAAMDSIGTARYIADQCQVVLPKAERLQYPIEAGDWVESDF